MSREHLCRPGRTLCGRRAGLLPKRQQTAYVNLAAPGGAFGADGCQSSAGQDVYIIKLWHWHFYTSLCCERWGTFVGLTWFDFWASGILALRYRAS